MAGENDSLAVIQPDVPAGRRGFLGRLVAAIAGGLFLTRIGSALAQSKGPAERPAGPAGTLGTLDGDPWLGEIALVPYNFAPNGWAFCNGQVIPISENTALFSLLGTTFGGDGRTTFALPDLRGRVPIHFGQGPGLTPRNLGEFSGEETHTLGVSEMPRHGHPLMADTAVGSTDSAVNAVPAKNAAGVPQYGTNLAAQMNPGAVGLTGNGTPHNNMPPFLVMNYIICLAGLFPSRS